MDTNEKKITETIELLTELMKVKSSIKNNISSDYTLASFKDAEKEYIAENYQNAEFSKELITRFGAKGYYYEFNDKNLEWEKDKDGMPKKIPIDEEEKKKIDNMGNRIFEFFMVHPHMVAILNRNKDENFLVKLLGKYKPDEEEPTTFGKDDRSILQKIKDKISGEETYEET